ncbi:MAG: CoA-binding protein, partial [Acidimicrobiales bacterium]
MRTGGLLEARTVAVVGASPRPHSLSARLLAGLEASPSRPEVHLVNPRYDRIGERPCLPSLDAVPGAVDLVALAVGDAALDEQLGAAAARGDRSAVIFASAFLPGQRERLAATAADAGMAVCGAACMGFINPVGGLRVVGYLEPDPLPEGPVALVTHSGSAYSALLRAERRIGWSLAVSSGQELVTTTADYVEHALAGGRTEAIALFLETLRDGPRLRSLLAGAARNGVPAVVLPVGASPGGRAMVEAHSGALAGDDATG